MHFAVLDIGIVAPGLPDWSSARCVLSGAEPYASAPLIASPPVLLAPNERRRATLPSRLALEVARQATSAADVDRSTLTSVLASSDGDMGLVDSLCRDIYQHRQSPSPTVFQNSVHNAAAGYWAIAVSCHRASCSLAAADGSFATGLLDAGMQALCSERPVLFMAVDTPAPALLHPHRPFTCAFACALLVTPWSARSQYPAFLKLGLVDAEAAPSESRMPDPALEAMRTGNPAARALPLLAAIANGEPATIRLPYLDELMLTVQLDQPSTSRPPRASNANTP